MELYKELAALRCFTHKDMVQLAESESAAACQIKTQVFYDVYFTTEKRVRPFFYDGVNYCAMTYRGNAGVIETDTGVRVTSLERTVIDSMWQLQELLTVVVTRLFYKLSESYKLRRLK